MGRSTVAVNVDRLPWLPTIFVFAERDFAKLRALNFSMAEGCGKGERERESRTRSFRARRVEEDSQEGKSDGEA